MVMACGNRRVVSVWRPRSLCVAVATSDGIIILVEERMAPLYRLIASNRSIGDMKNVSDVIFIRDDGSGIIDV